MITRRTGLALFFFLFLAALISHVLYYRDFETTLHAGVYIKDGTSYLDAARWSVPVVADWDSDGKKDLLIGHNYIDSNKANHGHVRFYRNTGTDPAPVFDGHTNIEVCSTVCSPLDASAFG